jgi:uncharacterized membrane protein
MNAAHFHLVVNHLPIIFPLVGVIILITGLISKSEAVKRMSFLVFFLGALTTVAAMTSGEGAEHIVEEIEGVSEDYIETHEELAETFALLSYLLGAVSVVALWASFKNKAFANIIALATLIFAIVVLFFGRQTGTSGGEIRHTEIRN